MKPSPTPPSDLLLVFGAHPDDIEFGAGGIIAVETARGRKVHWVVCSQGESGTSGTPELRKGEAEHAADILGARLEFVDLGGDAHFEEKLEHAITLARLIRQHRPSVILAPTPDTNQHPDHIVLARLVSQAARLARYGGFAELKDLPRHTIRGLLRYAITSEPAKPPLFLVDVSAELICWTRAMEAHATQAATRDYVTLQLTRAKLHGLHAGVEHALPLWSDDPVLLDSLAPLGRNARQF